MSFDRTLIAARERQDDEAALEELARSALAESAEDAALPLLRQGAENLKSARLWQWTGLLERALDQHERALASFGRAAALAPIDQSIAHGRARVALEAGLPAEKLFEAALHVSPGKGDVLLGYIASLFAAGKTELAESSLDSVLARSPLWVDGHIQLAQLRSTMGKKDQATASIERALQQVPGQEQLWIALFGVLTQAEQFVALDEAIARARRYIANERLLTCHEIVAAIERADVDRADRIFSSMNSDSRRSVAVWRIRHLLRTGRLGEACIAIDEALSGESALHVWPYAAIAWRLAGDPRWAWLEGDLERMVSVIDISSDIPDMQGLERVLRGLHVARGEYLDQSVRGGSQTDGPLFTRVDPEIRALRNAIVRAVGRHVEKLPPVDPRHPLLGERRDRDIRFSGSWSVLLRGAGYHSNHVHPEGWISSALYIHLPEHSEHDSKTAGWLTLGEPQAELGLDLKPFREIEPKKGYLVLFPSYMWHGTRPFEQGERLTVAFDVRRPR
ncbi:MAG TPA: putative 2OG-Fe(II) oxygenase [Sphingomicrobium sp.]|nr:putative 2OG-Fe(II) oxygenase [Sphingomicrobium sp.]